jgi:hypothetical protein
MNTKCDRKHNEIRILFKFRIPIDKDFGGKDHSYGVRFELDYIDSGLNFGDGDELLSLFRKTIL